MLNMSNMQTMLPGEESLQSKYLEMKCKEVDSLVKNKLVHNETSSPLKQIKMSVAKNLVNPSQESKDITLSANIHTSEPVTHPLTSNRPLPSIASVLAFQSSSSLS